MKSEAFFAPFPMPSEEDFLQEAIQAVKIGREICTCSSYYHPVWACLKAAGRMRGLYYQAAALNNIIRPLLINNSHVLIAGSADYCALQLLSAIGRDLSLRFTVVDQCDMPLQLIEKRFAGKVKDIAVSTLRHDLVDLNIENSWNLAFMHYTMTFLGKEQRQKMMRNLYMGLQPGGYIVCAIMEVDKVKEETSQPAVDEWVAKVTQTLETVFADHPDTLAEVKKMVPAYGYFRSQVFGDQPSEQDIVEEFEKAGFSLYQRFDDLGPAESMPGGIPPTKNREKRVLVLQKI